MILLRSAVFNVYFYGLTTLLGALGIFVRAFAPAATLGLAQLWARLALAGARLICGIEAEITGAERLPTGALLLAAQHQSAFDTLIWVTRLPKVSYVFKAELGNIPLFGPMLEAAGQIPLDRGAPVGAVRALIRAARDARAAGRQIVIFPEGTRVAVGAASTIRGGFGLIASRTGLPIYPVATNSGLFWSRRAFVKRPGRIRIHIGEPIPPTLPAAEMATLLKRRWAEADLGTPSVDNSVDGGS